MTPPSFHNTGDYVTDRRRLTEHTLASLGVADSYCLKVVPTALSGVTDTREGSVVLEGPPGSGKHTLPMSEQDSPRLRKSKWQQRSLHFPICSSARGLLVLMNWERKDGKC